MTTAKHKAYMPLNKRVYNVDMPLGKRVYNVWLAQDEFIRNPCRFVPYGTVADELFNAWYESNAIVISQNGNKWDITDNTTQYETLDQMSTVAPFTGPFRLNHLDIVVDKETVDDHFLMLQINQYENFVWGGSNTPIAEYRSGFNLVTGATAEILNPGGITNYVEDLTTQWRFIMEFNRFEQTTHILTQMYPAGGSSFPAQNPTATGTTIVECLKGFEYAYTP